MLNLNLNILGGGIQKNKSSYDPRLFFKMLENFYTASLLANARLDLIVSSSTTSRYYSTTITSSATPSTQEENIVVGSSTYLINEASGVTASFQGFPGWDVVQFGYPTLYNNVTMSLEIPEIGFSTSSYSTSSLLTTQFVAAAKGTYTINAIIEFSPYYDSTVRTNFNQSSSFTTLYNVTGSGTGFLVQNQFTASGVNNLNEVSVKPSGSITVGVKPTGNWGAQSAVFLTPQFSQSLVTMSLETPVGNFFTYNTASYLTASIGAPNYYAQSKVNVGVTSSVAIANPYIPVEYLVVGGGQSSNNVAGVNQDGGGGGQVQFGRFDVNALNANSIRAVVAATQSFADFAAYAPASGSKLNYKDSNNVTQSVFSIGGNRLVASGQCGTIYTPVTWLDGQTYGAFGVGGGWPLTSQSLCNKPSSSFVPKNSGVGGNGGVNSFSSFAETGSAGVVALRYYDPTNSVTASITGNYVVTNVSGGYKYVYFTDYSATASNAIAFSIANQESLVDIPTQPTGAAAFTMDYLLIGGGGAGGSAGTTELGAGGGGAGMVTSGSFTLSQSALFNGILQVGAGGASNTINGGQGYAGGDTTLNGSIVAYALGGGGGVGTNTATLAADGTYYESFNQPGGGNGGGGGGFLNATIRPYNFTDRFNQAAPSYEGGSGSAAPDPAVYGYGGGGAGASQNGQSANYAIAKFANGGTGSVWLDGNIYAGGGGGGSYSLNGRPDLVTGSLGGPGGGGRGGAKEKNNAATSSLPTAGVANTGAGGGGATNGQFGAAGGSGVAIFRIPTTAFNLISGSNHYTVTGTPQYYTSGSYTFIKYVNSGNLTIFNSII